jgi:hypothetical protein
MEYWFFGMTHHSTTPVLHHSNSIAGCGEFLSLLIHFTNYER